MISRISTRVPRQFNGKVQSFLWGWKKMVLEQSGIYLEKKGKKENKELRPFLHTIYKNEFTMEHRSKCKR